MNARRLAGTFRELRRQSGKTPKQIHAETGVNVYAVETRRKFGPTFLTVVRLAKAYGASLDEIARRAMQ